MSNSANIDDGFDLPWTWKNTPGYKPILIIAAAVIFITIVLLQPFKGMLDMVGAKKPPGYQMGEHSGRGGY
ncbi:MAG: hypothetical protein R6X10_00355 [Desulfobacterales bacterium]